MSFYEMYLTIIEFEFGFYYSDIDNILLADFIKI